MNAPERIAFPDIQSQVDSRNIHIVGPPATVEAMQQTLAGAGIAADQIRTEEFYGY